MAYLLDSNVFIQAKNSHYPFDVCPGFWDWVRREFESGSVRSIEKVRDELLDVDDDLSEWARNLPSEFYVTPQPDTLVSLRAVSAWANAGVYEASAVNIFLQAADYYLVAQALEGGHTVVTHEVPSASTKKIKIPDACIGVNVKCISPFDMLRLEKARFVLS